MTDLRSKSLIVAKGLMFLGIAAAAAVLLFLDSPTAKTAVLLLLLAWAASRFYYFLFYVLERYVDSSLRYAGLVSLIRAILAKRP